MKSLIKASPNAAAPTMLLLLGFSVAIALRMAIGGPGASQSAFAGLVFALCLVALGLAAKTHTKVTKRSVLIGLLGGLALCLPAMIARIIHGGSYISSAGYPPWALIVTIVAVAEEYFLRGALFDASNRWLGEIPAVIIAATAFAALHIPLYGWHIVPLDLAVGVWLGALRIASRSWTAAAIAHAGADLVAWWLR